MKLNHIFTTAILAALAIGSVSCNREFEEITDMNLSRCLVPTDLAVKVSMENGVDVTFDWNVGKDAESYNLVVYSDENMTEEILNENIPASEIPYVKTMTADQECWFKVRAISSKRDASSWAVFDGSFKTYAVKDNLFPAITARTSGSITMAWSTKAEDYLEVTRIECSPVKGGEAVVYELTEADIEAASATVQDLAPSTEYQAVLYYMSASRGGCDVWTMASSEGMTTVSTSADLIAAINAGSEIFLTLAGSPYAIGGLKVENGFRLVGEIGADGEKPVVSGCLDLDGNKLAGGEEVDIIVESITFSDGLSHNALLTYSGNTVTLRTVSFTNCDITGFKAGVLASNKDQKLTIETVSFDSCEIYDIPGSGGDFFDVRKCTAIGSVVFKNNTIRDGIRTLFRVDKQTDDAKINTIGGVNFQNNTVKAVAIMNDGNNRGLFSFYIPVDLTLKKNIFLWEDGGDAATPDKAQLVGPSTKTDTVVPTLAADNNYCYGEGSAFFIMVSAAEAGVKILSHDPCYNSKGNFFQLADAEVISKKAGASKWWIPYAEQEEDLTQNVLEGAHVWNFGDATLFAGDVKNSRVRDELLLVGSEALLINADGAINFTAEALKNKKGVPTEGFVSFKVNTPGSVDLEVANGSGSSVVVALADDNGFAVKGAAAVAAGAGVQKILIPAVEGEGTVYVYPTAAVSLTKLAWSLDSAGGNKVLAAPQPSAEPVTVTEGDVTDVVFTWEAVPNAAAYAVSFNKKAPVEQTELTFTVPGATISALSAGLYNFTVKAVPAEGDIYYTESQVGKASIAIQPKGGSGPVTETLTWDFSDAEGQAFLASIGASGTDITNIDKSYNGLQFYSVTKSKWNTIPISGTDYYFIQFGGAGVNATSGNLDRYLKFTAPKNGTLKIKVSNTGNDPAMDRMVYVKVGEGEAQKIAGGYSAASPTEIEFSIDAGDVYISTTGGLRFFKLDFTYTYNPDEEEPIEYEWNFSDEFGQAFLATIGTQNTDTENIDKSYEGLQFYSKSKSKWNTIPISGTDYYFIQFGGAGVNATSGNLDRYLKFTAPKNGTLKIKVSNTGNDPAMDRMVYVKVGEGEAQKIAGGYSAASPTEIEFSIDAGDVYISTTGSLRFFIIHYYE